MAKKILSSVAVIVIIAAMAITFVACNADTYESNLEKEGYVVTSMTAAQLESTGLFEGDDEAEIKEKIDWVVYGVNISEEKMIMVFKFKKTADAKELVEEAGEEEGFAIERQMSYVFIGTDKDAIKDAK